MEAAGPLGEGRSGGKGNGRMWRKLSGLYLPNLIQCSASGLYVHLVYTFITKFKCGAPSLLQK